MQEIEEDLIEIKIGDVTDKAEHGLDAGGFLLDLGKFVDVENQIQDDVHPHQHQKTEQVVLEKCGDDVAVDELHGHIKSEISSFRFHCLRRCSSSAAAIADTITFPVQISPRPSDRLLAAGFSLTCCPVIIRQIVSSAGTTLRAKALR